MLLILSFILPSLTLACSYLFYSRMFVVLCKLQGDLAHVRVLCYDYLHERDTIDIGVLLTIATTWPAALQQQTQQGNASTGMFVVTAVRMIIIFVLGEMLLQCVAGAVCRWCAAQDSTVDTNAVQLEQLQELRRICHWQCDVSNAEETVNQLLEELLARLELLTQPSSQQGSEAHTDQSSGRKSCTC